jgi:hypothetical protein
MQFVGRICSDAVIVHEPVIVDVEEVVVDAGTEVVVEVVEDVCRQSTISDYGHAGWRDIPGEA